MQNFDIARDALETSLNSSGSAMKEHEKWQQSLEARLNKLKSAWQGLSQAFLKSDFLKGALDAVIGLVDGLTKLIDTIGVLPTLITAFATAKTFTKGGGFFKVILDDATGTATGVTNVFTDAFNNVKALATSISQEAKFSFDGSDFATTLSGDESALMRYKLALDEGMSKQDAFNATMQKASPFAQNFAQTMQVTGESVAKFSEQQRISQLAMQASDKSLTNCGNLIRSYGDSMNTVGLTQQQFVQSIQETNPHLAKYLSGLNGAKGSLGGYIVSLVGAKAATIGLQIATTALNAVIGMGIGALVSFVISGITKWINAEKELAEKVEEVTSKFKEQHEELQKLKGDYDTSNESSMISKYEKLSKGVDNLGRNVSLTADEYSEYQSIVNKIAEQFPSLVSGFDSQGNAILSCKDNVEELTKAYEELIHAANVEVLNKAQDINDLFDKKKKDYEDRSGWTVFWQNAIPGGNSGYETNALSLGVLQDIYNGKIKNAEDLVKFFEDKGDTTVWGEGRQTWKQLQQTLKEADVEIKLWDAETNTAFSEQEAVANALFDAMKTQPEKIKNILDGYGLSLDEFAEGSRNLARAKLSEALDVRSSISGLDDYSKINEDLQSVARQVVENLDFDFFSELSSQGISVETWVIDMLNQLKAIGKEDSSSISAAFDLQTKFNGGEISYGEYVKGLEDAGELIDGLDLDPKLESQLKLSIGLDEDGIVAEYHQLRNRLADEDLFNISEPEYESFLEGLSAEELSVLIDIIPELSETDYKENIADIKAALEKEMMLQGLTFDLNLEVEAAGLEALNTALAESVSATGLSSESISALKGRYADLEAQGYDLSSMFEETSTGIRLNREEFNKLENAYTTEKLAEVDSDLEEMKIAYDDLGEAIKNCDDPIRKSELFNERQTLANRISEAATLAHQYKGLTNAYNDWLKAEEAGQERDMYESIIEGFENVGDEISRGWIDDGTIKFLELLTGRTDLAGKSGKQLKEIYDDLDNTIGNAGYSIRDFFTVNEDGESTNTGVYNFLETIESLGGKYKDAITKDDNGNIIGFNFEVAGGDEAIAEALGVSEELVQIMVRAADDAGFVVSMDGTYRQLADLQNEAKAAADYLRKIGKTDFEFDFNTSSVENLKTQLEEAHKILDDKKFWNKDGTFNFNADGATQAMQVVSTLQAKLDKLTQEQYGIGLTVEDEEFEEPLEKLQEYGRTIQTLNQLKLNPKANAEEIKELEGDLEEISKYFAGLDGDLKVDLGLDADDNWEDVKKKIEKGEVKIPTVLDIQANMDKNIETLTDLALLNSGLLSEKEEEAIVKKYKIEVEADEVDTSDVEDKVDNALGSDYSKNTRKQNIEIIAETFGIDDVDDLKEKLKGLNSKTIQTIAEVIGQIDVDKLKDTVAKLKPKQVKAIAKAIGEGDVEGLKTAINKLKPKHVQAIAEALGYDDVDELNAAIENLDPKTVQAVAEALGITDVDSLKAAIDNLKPKDVTVTANTSGESKVSGLKSLIDSIKDKFVTVTTWFKNITSGGSTRNDSNGYSDVNGTANVDGTAFANGTSGKAFKHGDWRTKKTETALTGELGREIVVTPDNRWYTVGDNGAEFATIPRGSIVFNHKQTEELFANGKVTSGGGRGRALASGTAYSSGFGGFGKVVGNAIKPEIKAVAKEVGEEVKKEVSSSSSSSSSSSNSNNSSGSSGSGGGNKVEGSAVGTQDKFEETFDWIEIAISRIEREIDNLDKTVNNTYKSWGDRNAALADEITKVGEEIALQDEAADKYLAKANGLGLDKIYSDIKDENGNLLSYAQLIQNGTLNIQDFEGDADEKTLEKIKEYQKWYELYLDCTDAAEDLKQTEAELYAQRFENVQSQYDAILQGFEHTETMLDEYISQAEAKGYIVSQKYYEALIQNKDGEIKALGEEQKKLLDKRDEYFEKQVEEYLKSHEDATRAQAEVAIKDSQQWRDMCAEIDGVTQAIEAGATALIEYDNAMRDIDWQVFDLIQERISDVTSEANFLIDLMSYDKLFDDNGKLTNQGIATMGLHGQNYNTYMYAADEYAKEIAKLNGQIADNPYDKELINRRQELIELQRESILAAEDEKQAIVDLVEEGINLELDALQERIDKHNEELDSMKDLYDYQKKVKEQTEEIASLEKQMAAYSSDDSEEAKAKVQELKVSLEEAKENLQESEYDRYISDQSALLDSLYEEYELVLNQRLDNVDALLAQVIDAINIASGAEGTIATALGSEGAIAKALGTNATTIKTTLETEAKSVGTTLSTAMKGIWSVDEGNAKSVITEYGKGFQDKQTTTNTVLGDIKADINRMVDDVDKDATTKVNSNKTTTSAKKNPTKTTTTQKKKTTTTNKKSSGGDGTPKVGDKVKFLSGKYYYDSQGKKPLGSKYQGKEVYITNINKKSWATHPYHISTGKKLGKGDLGWLKLNQLSGYAAGKKSFLDSELAWTQENGQEFIVRPSDGAILTPIAKGDSVLTSTASKNIWDMANSPAEFIKDNLNLGATSVPNNSNVSNNTVQHFENITFSMPNVKNYEQLLSEMQKDKSFEKLILAMTVDRIAGGSSLAKNKSIRK